jgi:hypothetical protein
LHKAGLRSIINAWADGALISAEVVGEKFGLKEAEFHAWNQAIDTLRRV